MYCFQHYYIEKNVKKSAKINTKFLILMVCCLWLLMTSTHKSAPNLTPKGQIGPTRAKPVLGSVVWAHTIFRILEFLFPNASQNKLCVSANFMISGATDQKLWVFENFRRSMGSQKTFYFKTFWVGFFFINSQQSS